MTPVFVQTDSKIIDITKITYINALENSAVIHFVAGRPITLNGEEAVQFGNALVALARRGHAVTHSARTYMKAGA